MNWFSFQENITNIISTNGQSENFNIGLFPNPATSKVTIQYSLPVSSNVIIEICSIEGIILKSFTQKDQGEGEHQLEIDTKLAKLNEGVYIVKFDADSYKKSLLLNILK